MTVFFYARLWRRSGVLTDLEFYEIRYSGKPARAVRGFRAVYLGLFFNCVIMATVNLAAVKIANVLLGWPMCADAAGLRAPSTSCFAAIAGCGACWSTDFIQFGIAMTGSVAAAVYFALQPPGGGRPRRARREARSAGALASCPTSATGTSTLTRADHSAHRAVVVGLVSGRRTGRRQLHRAAHARRRVGARRPGRHAVLQRRALRAALVAVDHRGARVDARLSHSSPTSAPRSRTWTRS